MVSYSLTGAVMLIPVRYNSSSKLYFAVAAFNTSAQPVNLGTEDVRIYMDGNQPCMCRTSTTCAKNPSGLLSARWRPLG